MALLDGRVALVTAAAGAGIGQATARRLLEEGADVVVTDAHARRAQEVAAALSKQFGREVLGLETNVTNREQAEGAVDAAVKRYGRLDILVNNAGINKLEPIWEMSDENWDTVIGVCLTGTFYMLRAALKPMMEQNFGLLTGKAERQQQSIDRILVQTTATNNRVTKLEDRPPFANLISSEEVRELVKQHRDLWSTWRFSRWFIPISIPVVLSLTTAVVNVVLWYVSKGG